MKNLTNLVKSYLTQSRIFVSCTIRLAALGLRRNLVLLKAQSLGRCCFCCISITCNTVYIDLPKAFHMVDFNKLLSTSMLENQFACSKNLTNLVSAYLTQRYSLFHTTHLAPLFFGDIELATFSTCPLKVYLTLCSSPEHWTFQCPIRACPLFYAQVWCSARLGPWVVVFVIYQWHVILCTQTYQLRFLVVNLIYQFGFFQNLTNLVRL